MMYQPFQAGILHHSRWPVRATFEFHGAEGRTPLEALNAFIYQHGRGPLPYLSEYAIWSVADLKYIWQSCTLPDLQEPLPKAFSV